MKVITAMSQTFNSSLLRNATIVCALVGFSACQSEQPQSKTPEQKKKQTKVVAHPEGILSPSWLEEVKEEQFSTRDKFKVFHDFHFKDRLPESDISFVHDIVNDSGKFYRANHYDHGNGVAVADRSTAAQARERGGLPLSTSTPRGEGG